MEDMENKEVVETTEVKVENEAPVAVDDGKKFSVAALVLGILGIVGGWFPIVCYFTTICAILGPNILEMSSTV